MKTKLQSPVIFFLILVLFMLSCGPVSEVVLTPANTDLPSATQESPAIVTPEETSTTTSPSSQSSPYTPFGVTAYKYGVETGLSVGGEGGGSDGFEVDYSGMICSLERPFTLTDPDENFGVLQFTPSSPNVGSVIISGGWILERGDNQGNYTVEDSQSNPNISEGNLGLHILTSEACFSGMRLPNQGCFPLDSWIILTPLETTECG